MGNDTDVTVEASPSDWVLVEAALAGVISQRMRELMASRPGSWERACIEDGLRPLERVSHLILEAVYPDTSEEDEGEDDPYQRADDLTLVEDHGLPLISVGKP